MKIEEKLKNKQISFEELLELFDVVVALEIASAYRLPQSKGGVRTMFRELRAIFTKYCNEDLAD